jgi:hypothetical protein
MATDSPGNLATGSATITAHEAEQIEHANATGLQPVVFIHDLWLLPSSWDRWATVSMRLAMSRSRPAGQTILRLSLRQTQSPRSLLTTLASLSSIVPYLAS